MSDEEAQSGWTGRRAPGGNSSQYELLVRVDERTSAMLNEIQAIKASTVTKAEFGPVRALVFGMVSLMAATVFIGLLSLVVRGQ